MPRRRPQERLTTTRTAVKNTGPFRHRILIGTPTLGQIRIEWMNALFAMVVPCNWANSWQTPIGFLVDDAQNIICKEVIEKGFEWVWFIEDDVVPQVDCLLKLNHWMLKKEYPVISGLYYLKGSQGNQLGPEPLIYRGRGNGAFRDFKEGDKVWVDGVPTGCLLVHASILRAMTPLTETYTLNANNTKIELRRYFEFPRKAWLDPQSGQYLKQMGTSDLYWCDTLMKHDILAKAGWKNVAKKKYPFLVDTSIRCGHIDRDTGEVI